MPGMSVPARMRFTAAELTEIRHAFRQRLATERVPKNRLGGSGSPKCPRCSYASPTTTAPTYSPPRSSLRRQRARRRKCSEEGAALSHSLRRRVTEARATPDRWAYPERRRRLTKVASSESPLTAHTAILGVVSLDAEGGRPSPCLASRLRGADTKAGASGLAGLRFPATGCASGRIAPGRSEQR
jgi:hypothetical protein